MRSIRPVGSVADRPPREYGPHDEAAHADRTVTATFGSYPGRPGNRYRQDGPYREETLPIPKVIAQQIRSINTVAYERGQRARRERETES